jgi:hypothetical protein
MTIVPLNESGLSVLEKPHLPKTCLALDLVSEKSSVRAQVWSKHAFSAIAYECGEPRRYRF